jgi:hypothetical protein
MKYSERIIFLENIFSNPEGLEYTKEDYLQARNKKLLKELLPKAFPCLQEAKDILSKNDPDVLVTHENLSEVRTMYHSLSTILITSSLFYVEKNTSEEKIWHDHWDLVPEIANILGLMLDDIFSFHYNMLNEDPSNEKVQEKNHRINVMRLLTWGLNTGVYKIHPNRLEGYENKFWGIPLTEEEREDLWATGWKKHIPKVKTSSLIDVMNQQKKELELPKNDLTSIKRNTFIKEEKDWGRFRRG